MSGYEKDTYDFELGVWHADGQVLSKKLSLPRVTGIIGSVWSSSFSPASWWGYKLGVQAATNLGFDMAYEDVKSSGPTPESARDEASDRGVAAHDMLQALMEGEELDEREPTSPFEDAVIQWHHEVKPVNLGAEIKVLSLRGGYAGTLDLMWRRPKGKLRELTDLKTRGKLGVRTTDCIQVCAYADAYEEMYDTSVDKLSVLVAAESGKAKLYPVDRGRYGPAWQHTLAIYKALRGE